MTRLPLTAAAAAVGICLVGALAPVASAGNPDQSTVVITDSGNGDFLGNGVLISADWVLTAAHVVDGRPPASLLVTVGDTDRCDPDEGPEQFHSVAINARDPNFNKLTLDHDFALLGLSSSVAFNAHVQPACVPSGSEDFAGATADILGWWALINCNATVYCLRQEMQLQILSNADTSTYYPSGAVTAAMLGVLDTTFSGQAPLYQSGGSGAFVQTPDGTMVVGLVSWGAGTAPCVNSNYPTVLARVSEARTWIESWVTLPPCQPPPPPTPAERATVVIKKHGSFVGSGVLIDPEWVLAPASLVGGSYLDYSVVVGDQNRCVSDGTEQNASLIDILVDPTLGSDIALLHLSSPVVLGPYVQPICLPRTDQDFAGATVGVHGWWSDDPCTGLAACNRKAIQLSVLADWDAENNYGLSLPDEQVAMLDKVAGADAPFRGSHGAGAYVEGPDETVLVGLMLYSSAPGACVDPGEPSVFARVSESVAWIEVYVGPSTCPAPPRSAAQRAAVLIHYEGQFTGNGVLVADDWVLTAAHLVDGRQPSSFEIFAGASNSCDPTSGGTQVRSIDSYTWPTPDSSPCGSGYDPLTLEDNLALLHLSAPVVTNAQVEPIPRAPGGDDFAGSWVETRGWWMTSPCTSEIGCGQIGLQQPVIQNSLANTLFAPLPGVSIGPCHLATYDTPGSYLPWHGSAGAGAYASSGGTTVLAGIRSWNIFGPSGCISPTYPVVYSRVSSYAPWIDWVLSFEPPHSLGGGSVPPCGAGCGSPELITVGGPPVIGNHDFGLEINSTPDAGFTLLLVGIGASTGGIPWEGGMIYAPTGVSFWHWNGIVPVVATSGCSGTAAFPLPFPADPGLVGNQLTPQGLFVCPSLVEMVPTNAITLTIQ